MEKRVVITGLGAISPIGNNVKDLWEGIKTGKCGIDEITAFDTTTFKTKLGAEVKGYDPLNYFEAKQAKRMDRVSQFAIVAAREAFKDSGMTSENTDLENVGVFVGSGIFKSCINASNSFLFSAFAIASSVFILPSFYFYSLAKSSICTPKKVANSSFWYPNKYCPVFAL